MRHGWRSHSEINFISDFGSIDFQTTGALRHTDSGIQLLSVVGVNSLSETLKLSAQILFLQFLNT